MFPFPLSHGWSLLILVCAAVLTPVFDAWGDAAARRIAAKHARPTGAIFPEKRPILPDRRPTSAFATPPSTPLRSATQPYSGKSNNPDRKRTRKLRAQMANSMAARTRRDRQAKP